MPRLTERLLTAARRLAMKALARPDGRVAMSRLGSDYGGWWVPNSILVPGAVCVAAGVGEDITFDLALATEFGLEVFAVDPTPRARDFVAGKQLPANLRFINVGLWSEDGMQRFYAPADPSHVSHSITNLQRTTTYFEARCVRLATLREESRIGEIALLKLDIEGAEFAVINDLLDSEGPLPRVICLEFDQPATLQDMRRLVRRLRRAGYAMLRSERWNYTFGLALA